MSDLSFDIYENISINMEQNITHYPTEATILAAACACIFSVVGVVGKLLFNVDCLSINNVYSIDFIGRTTNCMSNTDASFREKR